MMRLFYAFPLTPGVQQELAKIVADLRVAGGPVKWVEPHNTHLTLRFLGDTQESVVPQLRQALDDLATNRTRVHSRIDRLGVFPNIKRPNVIWVGLGEQVELLADMNRQIEDAVRVLGFEPDNKSFKAHLTLGRVKDQRNLESLTAMLPNYRFVVIPVVFDQVVLYQSTLTPKGPVYERLHTARLAAEH